MKFSPRRQFFLLCVLSATGIAASPAGAEENRYELTPFGGLRTGGTFNIEDSDASYKLDDSGSFGLLFNVRQSPDTQWEVLYSRQQTDALLRDSSSTASSVDTTLHVFQIGGTYQGAGEKLRPYVAMTLGGTHIRTSASEARSDTFFSGSLGLGVNMLPTNRIGVRLEARAYGTLTQSSTDLFCSTGPDNNVCAIRIDGTVLSQVELFAGLVFRF